jgi:hypothetical protein
MPQLVTGDLQVGGDVVENRSERSQTKCMVTRNRDVMLFRRGEGQAHVTPGLPGDRVAHTAESSRKIIAGDVAGKSQTAMTCSRVKCNRTTRGISSSSK